MFYYPAINVVSLDEHDTRLLRASEEFGPTLFRLFRGLRTLRALKQCASPPERLFVEPSRSCNLACTYCYAEAGPEFRKRLDLEAVSALVRRYNFNDVSILGGEPLVDKGFVQAVHDLKPWGTFFLSTNGILAGPEFLSRVVDSPASNVQVSIEPREWTSRVTRGGTRQLDLMQGKLKLFRGPGYALRVTIPPDAPYVPLKDFIDEVGRQVESDDFSISYWSAIGSALPTWLNRWIEEAYAILRDDVDGKYRKKLPGSATAANLFSKVGFRFHFCDAAFGAIAIGPDRKLHGCHINAIMERGTDVVSSDADPLELDQKKVLEVAYRWTSNMSAEACARCAMRYMCGGMCFLITPPVADCDYLSKVFPLILTELNRYEPEEVSVVVERTQRVFEELFALRQEYESEVASDRWSHLLAGKLPVQEALDLADAVGVRTIRAEASLL